MCTNGFVSGWYLIYTRPRHEKKVHAQLTDNLIDSFLPTRKTLRTWHDRKKYIDEPLFPSYVFVRLESRQSFHTGMDTDGYLYYVRTGKEIARVKDSVVDSIKLIMSRNQEIEVSDRCFQAGQQMVIREGALTGLPCEVVRWNNKKKLLVRVDLLQRSLLLNVPEDFLVPQSSISL